MHINPYTVTRACNICRAVVPMAPGQLRCQQCQRRAGMDG